MERNSGNFLRIIADPEVPFRKNRDSGSGVNSSFDLYTRLQLVTNQSEEDLGEYSYPAGPVLGVGYGNNGTVVMIDKSMATNETLLEKIYRIIGRHGEENGIKKIPGTFYSIDVVKLD